MELWIQCLDEIEDMFFAVVLLREHVRRIYDKRMDHLNVIPTFAEHYESLKNHCVDQTMNCRLVVDIWAVPTND